jgi:dTDP-4-dehydrorhamnose 3,5-epimerase-like enzyme
MCFETTGVIFWKAITVIDITGTDYQKGSFRTTFPSKRGVLRGLHYQLGVPQGS